MSFIIAHYLEREAHMPDMEYIIGWRGPPTEKWILCRRAYIVYISPFPDAYVAELPFCGDKNSTYVLANSASLTI